MSTRRSGYFTIDRHFLFTCGRQVGPSAGWVWCNLKSAANTEGYCWPTLETIAAETGLSRSTIKSALRQLAHAGWISIAVHSRSGSMVHNGYQLTAGFKSDPVESTSRVGNQPGAVLEINPEPGQILAPSRVEIQPQRNIRKKPNKETLLTVVDRDGRSSSFKGAISAYYSHMNPEANGIPWDGSEAKQLSSMLQANPHLSLEDFRQLLRNRSRSEVNHADRPRKWIADVTKFTQPLDRFGMPKGEHTHDSVNRYINSPVSRQQRSNGSIDGALDGALARRGFTRDSCFDDANPRQLPEPGDNRGDGLDVDGSVDGAIRGIFD